MPRIISYPNGLLACTASLTQSSSSADAGNPFAPCGTLFVSRFAYSSLQRYHHLLIILILYSWFAFVNNKLPGFENNCACHVWDNQYWNQKPLPNRQFIFHSAIWKNLPKIPATSSLVPGHRKDSAQRRWSANKAPAEKACTALLWPKQNTWFFAIELWWYESYWTMTASHKRTFLKNAGDPPN